MGSIASKLHELTGIESSPAGTPLETPLETPAEDNIARKKSVLIGIDPRSPSQEISRTPIQIVAKRRMALMNDSSLWQSKETSETTNDKRKDD